MAKIKVLEFNSSFEVSDRKRVPENLIIVRQSRFSDADTFTASLITECKRPQTAINRLFKTLENDKRFSSSLKEKLLDSCNYGLFRGTTCEYHWQLSEAFDYSGCYCVSLTVSVPKDAQGNYQYIDQADIQVELSEQDPDTVTEQADTDSNVQEQEAAQAEPEKPLFQAHKVTSKEIAIDTIRDIAHKCDIANGYWSWSDYAEKSVYTAFQAARDSHKSVTAVADEIAKESDNIGGERFGYHMRMAVGSVLAEWFNGGMLRGYEINRAIKVLGYEIQAAVLGNEPAQPVSDTESAEPAQAAAQSDTSASESTVTVNTPTCHNADTNVTAATYPVVCATINRALSTEREPP